MKKYRGLKILARFQPTAAIDLKPDLVKAVDAEALFTYAWQMDEDGPFPDEWVLKTADERFGDYWIPERDLTLIRICHHGDCQKE